MNRTIFGCSRPVRVNASSELNATFGFYADVPRGNSKTVIKLTASTFYRLYINNKFIFAGPARAAAGYFRVDELDISDHLTENENRVAVEVTSYLCDSFAYTIQESFLQAEITRDGVLLAATGTDLPFFGLQLKHRIKKVPKYSYQRAFTEAYSLSPDFDLWKKPGFTGGFIPETVGAKHTVGRNIPLNVFTEVPVAKWLAGGSAVLHPDSKEPYCPRFIVPDQGGHIMYSVSELELPLQNLCREFEYGEKKEISAAPGHLNIAKDSFADGTFGRIKSGFFAAELSCHGPATLWIMFQEHPFESTDGEIRPTGVSQAVNCVYVHLEDAGTYKFRTAEPYVAMSVRLIATAGDISVGGFRFEEYRNPDKLVLPFTPKTEKLRLICDAAIETFAQNSSDIFMDCPSRERAGWLCDGYFEGRVGSVLTEKPTVERNFLENFALADSFESIPDGMLPMCYPSDHVNGEYIPQWAMWYFLQLSDYAERTGDGSLVPLMEEKCRKLLAFFEKYEDENGFPVNIPGWNFVEWSRSNDLANGRNFPIAMLYSEFLSVCGRLYGIAELEDKAERLRENIRRYAFDGRYFRDHDVPDGNGGWTADPECTETAQYYAFYFGAATPESHPDLWERLCTVFGPGRDPKLTEPQISPSNAFIGNYLRLEILRRYGKTEQMEKEIEGYFIGMAESTGTLWEFMSPGASCDHGFASYVIYLLSNL